MNISISPEQIAKNINKLDLIKIMSEFKRLNPKFSMAELCIDAEEEFIEGPIRDIVYSNKLITYMIRLNETNITTNSKRDKELDEILNKANLLTENGLPNTIFFNIMKETQEPSTGDVDFLYNFGYIQDQVWYEIYPKYL